MELEPRLAEAREGKRTLLWVDASHFVLASFLGYVWCFVREVREGGVGSPAVQRAGGVECLDARVDHGNQHGVHHAESVCALLRKVAQASVGVPITM